MAVREGNLPVELTSFVGRRSELAETRRLLSESRLVTLTGLGGVGKTRLALRVADDTRRAFVDGTWLVELAELRDPALLDQTVTTALGIQDRSNRSPRAVLVDHLRDSHALIVLDNCEHLIAAVADLVSDLLRSCPALVVLATSREPLGVPGEFVQRVPPLGIPDSAAAGPGPESSDGEAVALFEQRARAALPEFRITDDNVAVVRQICRRLDGLPLPIELAAARLRTMSLDEILARLNDRFQLLTRGSRTAPSRQQALRWSIDWSYDLCTVRERWLWRCLTVFAGSFELDAVEGVLAEQVDSDDLLDLVTSLLDKSILILDDFDPIVRYRMLDTLREYGRDQIQDLDEDAELHRRHRDWYENLVQRMRGDWIGPRQREWTSRLDREQANLRDAFEFSLAGSDAGEAVRRTAGALYDFWLLRGRLSEGRYWLDRALAEGDDGSAAVRVEAAATDSVLAALQQDLAPARALADEAQRIADPSQERDVALVQCARGLLEIVDGDMRCGVALLDAASAVLRSDADLMHYVWAQYWLGYAFDSLGDVARATEVYEKAMDLTASRGEIMWHAMMMSDYGSTLFRTGDPARGSALLEESLGLLRELNNQLGCGWAFEQLAWTVVGRDAELAAVLMGAADARLAATGTPLETFRSTFERHDECVRAAHGVLGDKAFESAFEQGRVMSLDEAIARALAEPLPEEPVPVADVVALTPREEQVAELVAQGLTNKAIAEQLHISQRTVEGHVEHVRDKLGFSSRTQIAAWMVRRAAEG